MKKINLSEQLNFSGAITIGGVQQWIYIQGTSSQNPILLFLHGGPGFAESTFSYLYAENLKNDFTIIQWDQRGSNRSASSLVTSKSMTISQMVKDTQELIRYLKNEYSEVPINLVGHSWGTVLGLLTAASTPEVISSYTAIGQAVDMEKGEILSYDFVCAEAKRRNILEAIDELKKIGPPPLELPPIESDSFFV